MAWSCESAAIDRRRAVVSDLYCAGKTMKEIAKEIGDVGVTTIWRDLAAIKKQWVESSLRDFDSRRMAELGKLDAIEEQAIAGWERSQRSEKTVTVKNNADGTEHTTKVVGQAGDSAFLGRVIDCIDKRCKILGLNAPEKVAETDADGNDLTIEQRRERIHALIDRLSGRIRVEATPASLGHAGNGLASEPGHVNGDGPMETGAPPDAGQ